ncbi:protein ROOT HAIR DEFECTIVE 3 2-like [Salvia divinorum]|uniref:Protein ROOT HAIR DEFECTIVE 3 2-like n=1 Tax=Salvia divinorum TaxID=28513 RepID=A0ABD1G2U0_SALDI
MKIRFIVASSKDGDTMDKEKPYRQCLDFLAAMAVIRLDDAYDVVQRVLHSELMGGVGISTEYLSSVTWEKVSHGVTLITPLECREIWTRFQTDMELHLAKTDAYKKALESNSTGKEGGAWTPPTWVILGLSVLGVTAFVGVLICYPEVVPALAISAALATGIAKQLKMNQGSPSLMEFLQKDLRRVYDCMTTVNDIAKLVVKNVA